jgi:hypothetical protein
MVRLLSMLVLVVVDVKPVVFFVTRANFLFSVAPLCRLPVTSLTAIV